MKIILALIFSALLTSCAVQQEAKSNYIERAEKAISEAKWEVGYRLLEDGLLSLDTTTKSRAIELYRAHPSLGAAAAKTFSKESIEKSFKDNGKATAIAMERQRLRQYAVVATNEEIETAIDMVEGYVNRSEAEEAKRQQARAEAAAKAEADAKVRSAEAVAYTLSLKRGLETSRAKAFFRCKDAVQCEKAFALTQIFIATHSDMKIQLANDAVIETFNPNREGAMGATAMKFPLQGSSAEIRLAVACKGNDSIAALNDCLLNSTRMNLAFEPFMRERLLK